MSSEPPMIDLHDTTVRADRIEGVLIRKHGMTGTYRVIVVTFSGKTWTMGGGTRKQAEDERSDILNKIRRALR